MLNTLSSKKQSKIKSGAKAPLNYRGQKMKIRADFDFKEEAMGIKACKGYVIGEFTPTEEGGDFKPEDVILERLVAKSPDLKKIEAMAIANCKVLYDDNEVEEVINVGRLADYHE